MPFAIIDPMMEKLILASMLHDIGKIFTNYLWDYKPEIIEEAKRITGRKYLHAVVGAMILKDADFPDYIIAMVAHHHDGGLDEYTIRAISKRFGNVDNRDNGVLNTLMRSDRFDSSFRIEKEEREKGEPIEITKRLGLSASESLHGEEITKVINDGLVKLSKLCKQDINRAISFADALLKEISIHLRADQSDPIISLYAHSKITAAIASSFINFPNDDLTLISVKVKIDEKARFATSDVVEYFAGLHLYTYFGLIGCIAKTLKKFNLNADAHIVAESSTHLLLILPESTIKSLIENFRLLVDDILCPIEIEIFKLKQSDKQQQPEIKFIAHEIIRPTQKTMPFGVRTTCNICKRPFKDVAKFSKIDKDLILCPYCSIIAFSYRVISPDKVYSIIEGDKGLFVYPTLRLGVINGVTDDTLIGRVLNPNSSRSVLEYGFPSFDLFISPFKKELKIWTGISLNKFIQQYKNRLHALVSLYQIIPLFLGKILTKTNVNSIEISSSGAIFQSSSLKQVITALKFIGLNNIAVAIVKQGAPGMTYQKLNIMLERLNKGDTVLAVYSMDNSLTQKDIEKLNEIKLKILDFNSFLKSLFKVNNLLEKYLHSEDKVEKVYAKSELLRLFSYYFRRKGEMEEHIEDLVGILGIFGEGISTVQKGEVDDKEEISKLLENQEYIQALLRLINIGVGMEELI